MRQHPWEPVLEGHSQGRVLGQLGWQQPAVEHVVMGLPASVVSWDKGLVTALDEVFILFRFKNISKLRIKS